MFAVARPGVLRKNLRTTRALVFLIFAMIEVTRGNDKAKCLVTCLSGIAFAAVLPMLGQGLRLPRRNSAVEVTAAGIVNLQAFVATVHRGMLQSWVQIWNSMFHDGLLTCNWDLDLPLVDVCLLLAQMVRVRRTGRQKRLGSVSIGLQVSLQDLMVHFIAGALVQYWQQFTFHKCLQHMSVFTASAPARRFKRQRVSDANSKVLVDPEQVWSMMEEATEKKCSLHNVLKVRKTDRQGGTGSSSAEKWAKKVLGICLGKTSLSFLNLPHLQFVTDGSTQSGRETVVTIVYSHETDAVGLAPAQCVSRVRVISPGEFELEPDVEEMAAKRQVERLSAYRWLQALSHQIALVSRHRLNLASYVAPASMRIGPMSPEMTRAVVHGQLSLRNRHAGDIAYANLSTAMTQPILTASIDQGGIGAVPW